MIFLETFNFSLTIFYLVGLKPATNRVTNKRKFTDHISVIITSASSVSITVYLVFFPHFPSYGVIFVLIYYGSLIPSLLMILTANVQCYLHKNTYYSILKQIGKLERMMKEKTLNLSINNFAFRYKLKVTMLYILFLLSQTLVFFEVWFLHLQNSWSSILISLIRLTYPMQLSHFVLHCDTVTMFFIELNKEIQNSPVILRTPNKIKFLKYVKLMHLDLWKLMVKLNNFFGLNLLFTTIFWFIDITHQLYWIFLSTHAKLNLLGLLGELKNKT